MGQPRPPRVTVRERPRSDGTVAYNVIWRKDNRQHSRTCDDRMRAEHVRRVVEATGDYTDADDRAALLDADTFDQWSGHYLAHLTAVSDRTRDDYRRQLARHMSPAFGSLPLALVSRDVVRRWVTTKSREVSAKTLANLHGLLSACMAGAVEAGHIAANPCRGIKLPRNDDHDREDMVILSRPQFRLLYGEIPEHYRPFVGFLAGTGLRFGEAAALTVGDVDLMSAPATVRVTKALRREPGGFVVGPTKTRKSRRTVSLPDDLVDALAGLVMRSRTEPLFVTEGGDRMHHGNFHKRVWTKAVLRAMDPDRHGPAALTTRPRIHDLRHCHASWMLADNVPMNIVQSRLGHEDIRTTANTYGHLMPDALQVGADAAQRALNGVLR